MERKTLRVSIAPEKETDADALVAALEDALGHPLEIVLRLRRSGVLSCRLAETELETVRSVPGVRCVQIERRAEIPPAPRPPRAER